MSDQELEQECDIAIGIVMDSAQFHNLVATDIPSEFQAGYEITRQSLEFENVCVFDLPFCTVTDLEGKVLTEDDFTPAMLGKEVIINEEPCPMCSCNHWVKDIHGKIAIIGFSDTVYQRVEQEPAKDVMYWLQ
jgi:hypothetical protein